MKKRMFCAFLALTFIFFACKNPAGSDDNVISSNPNNPDGGESLSTTFTGTKSAPSPFQRRPTLAKTPLAVQTFTKSASLW